MIYAHRISLHSITHTQASEYMKWKYHYIWHAWQPWYQARLPVITTVLQLNKNDTANRKTLSHPPPTTPSSTAAKLSYMPATHRITPSAAIHARGVDNLANVNRLLGVYIHDAPHVLAVEEGGVQVVFLHNLLNNTQHSTAVTQYSTAQHSTAQKAVAASVARKEHVKPPTLCPHTHAVVSAQEALAPLTSLLLALAGRFKFATIFLVISIAWASSCA